ncbi:MAG: arsenate reductase family protein [Luteolibacter sp.]
MEKPLLSSLRFQHLPPMHTLYAYKNCDTCRKAIKWLDTHAIPYQLKAIRETPPSPAELRTALAAHGGDLRPLFNTSGGDYRELNLKEKLPTLTADEAIDLLSKNGNLVKRPFLIGQGVVLNGFKEDIWNSALL